MVQVVTRQGNGFSTQPLIVNLPKLKGKEKERERVFQKQLYFKYNYSNIHSAILTCQGCAGRWL